MTEQVIILGQTVMRFDTPQFILDEANRIYDHRKEHELPPTNKFLAGKIRNEHTLYHFSCLHLSRFREQIFSAFLLIL